MRTAVPTYVCGCTDDKRGGIFNYSFDDTNGQLMQQGMHPQSGMMFCALTSDGEYLYAASSRGGGTVSSYSVGDATNDLSPLNTQSSCGQVPAYISIDSRDRYVFVANYGEGTIAALPIEQDGRLGAPTDTVEHEGTSIHPDRQSAPHPHSIIPGPNDRFVFVPDLGTDTIENYEFDFADGEFEPADSSSTRLHDGAGPRHLTFHPTGEHAYVINELDSTITVFGFEPENGALNSIETVQSLPETYNGDNLCADIHVHPSGKWLYGSNRGHDSIVVMEVDSPSGRVETVSHESTGINWPRHFAIDPNGEYLVVTNRRDDSIVAFEIVKETGELQATGHVQDVPEPICIQFS